MSSMVDGFLPTGLEPTHYDLHLHDLHLWEERRSFKGRVLIQLNVVEPTSLIILDAYQLHDISASIPGRLLDIRHDPGRRRLHIRSDPPLDPGEVALEISWRGIIGDEVGFYRTGDLFCTQFQPIDARRAFPCFDEPRFKTTFDLTIEVPRDLVALGNMPIERRFSAGEVDVVKFARTPRMSTYLLAWAIGRMEYVETIIPRSTVPLPIRVYAISTAIKHAQFALHTAARALSLFTEMFRIDYPLPKLDLLAVDEMTDEAMENWGLCIFKSNVLLLEGEPNLNPSDVNRVAYIIAHELAHQWFGNLVTPSTWDELWLNEGFATWAGWYAVDKLHPDWDIWPLFIVDTMHEGFELDSMESTHPVQVHVPSDLEVDSMFDDISYLKGASVIRMLANYMGESRFIAGVAKYLAKNAYGSGTGSDLWLGLEAVSGEPIGQMVRSWIHKPGFPVVTVTDITPEGIAVKQSSIIDTKTKWWIPLLAQTEGGTVNGSIAEHRGFLPLASPFLKLNHASTGFYRTVLPQSHLKFLQSRLHLLSPADRLGLLDDVATLTYEEEYPIATLMSLLQAFSHETHYAVWMCILQILQYLRTTFANDNNISSKLRSLSSNLISPALRSMDWSPSASDDYNRAMLRPLILREAGITGDTAVVAEALRRFDRNEQETFDMLRVICSVAVAARGLTAVETLLARYQLAKTTRERDIYATAMGNLSSRADALQALHTAFHGKVLVTQDLFTLAASMSENGPTTDVFWEFMRDDFDFIIERMGDATTTLERLLRETLSNMSSFERAKEVRKFFKNRNTTGYKSGLDVAVESIEGNAELKKDILRDLKHYLESI